MLKIIIKNIDKRSFIIYGISIAFFSTILYLIASLIDINDSINLGGNSENVKIVFVLYYIIIILSGFMFILYSLRFYIKTRIQKYGLFVVLGIPKIKVYMYLMTEFLFVFLIATIIGILMGNVVLVLLKAVFLLNGKKIVLDFTELCKNAMISLIGSFVIFVLGCINGLFNIVKKDLSNVMTIKRRREYRHSLTGIFAVGGIIITIKAMELLDSPTFGDILLSLCLSFFGV